MMLKNKFFICTVLIIVLTACIVNTGCTSTQSAQSPTITPPTPSPTTAPGTLVTSLAPTTAPATVISTTETQKNDILTVTLNSAVKKTMIGKATNKAGNIFLVVDVTILNNDKNNDFKYTDASFAIFDKLNQNRRNAITSQLLTGGLNSPLSSGTIPLKSTKTGQIVFGVMDSSNSYKLYISNSTGTVIASVDNINVP
jgi:hypothetical protein